MSRQSKLEQYTCTERAIRSWPANIRYQVFRVCKVPRAGIVNESAQECYALMASAGVRGARKAAALFKKYIEKQ